MKRAHVVTEVKDSSEEGNSEEEEEEEKDLTQATPTLRDLTVQEFTLGIAAHWTELATRRDPFFLFRHSIERDLQSTMRDATCTHCVLIVRKIIEYVKNVDQADDSIPLPTFTFWYLPPHLLGNIILSSLNFEVEISEFETRFYNFALLRTASLEKEDKVFQFKTKQNDVILYKQVQNPYESCTRTRRVKASSNRQFKDISEAWTYKSTPLFHIGTLGLLMRQIVSLRLICKSMDLAIRNLSPSLPFCIMKIARLFGGGYLFPKELFSPGFGLINFDVYTIDGKEGPLVNSGNLKIRPKNLKGKSVSYLSDVFSKYSYDQAVSFMKKLYEKHRSSFESWMPIERSKLSDEFLASNTKLIHEMYTQGEEKFCEKYKVPSKFIFSTLHLLGPGGSRLVFGVNDITIMMDSSVYPYDTIRKMSKSSSVNNVLSIVSLEKSSIALRKIVGAWLSGDDHKNTAINSTNPYKNILNRIFKKWHTTEKKKEEKKNVNE